MAPNIRKEERPAIEVCQETAPKLYIFTHLFGDTYEVKWFGDAHGEVNQTPQKRSSRHDHSTGKIKCAQY